MAAASEAVTAYDWSAEASGVAIAAPAEPKAAVAAVAAVAVVVAAVAYAAEAIVATAATDALAAAPYAAPAELVVDIVVVTGDDGEAEVDDDDGAVAQKVAEAPIASLAVVVVVVHAALVDQA